MFLTLFKYLAFKVAFLNSKYLQWNVTPGTCCPSLTLGPSGGAANVILLPLTVYALPGSCRIPSRVIVSDCSLYGVIVAPLSSTNVNTVLPSRFPRSVNAPVKAPFKYSCFALISVVLNVSRPIDPAPRSILSCSVLITDVVTCFLVLTTVILFLLGSQSCTILVPTVFVFGDIGTAASDSTNTSPNNWKPAG